MIMSPLRVKFEGRSVKTSDDNIHLHVRKEFGHQLLNKLILILENTCMQKPSPC
jgi:hypothetical protein